MDSLHHGFSFYYFGSVLPFSRISVGVLLIVADGVCALGIRVVFAGILSSNFTKCFLVTR